MNNRTINGHSMDECMKLLERPPMQIKEKTVGKNTYHYVPTQEYQARLNEVFGVFNYSVEYTDPIVTAFSKAQVGVYITCTITVFDDEGRVVCKKSCSGGVEMAYRQPDQKQKNTTGNTSAKSLRDFPNLSQESSNAAKSAFRETCKCFCIFGFNTDKAQDLDALYMEYKKRYGTVTTDSRLTRVPNRVPVEKNCVVVAPDPKNTQQHNLIKVTEFTRSAQTSRPAYVCSVSLLDMIGGYQNASKPLIIYEDDLKAFADNYPGIQSLLSIKPEEMKPVTCVLEDQQDSYRLVKIMSVVARRAGE